MTRRLRQGATRPRSRAADGGPVSCRDHGEAVERPPATAEATDAGTSPSGAETTGLTRQLKLALVLALTLAAVAAVVLAGGFEDAATVARSAGREVAAVVVPEAPAEAGAVLGATDAGDLELGDQGTETPAFDQYGTKVTVCHNPGFDQQTMRVASVEQHLAHGDYVGPCW